VLLYSSLVDFEVECMKAKYGLMGKVLLKKKLPFRVPRVLNNSEWLNKLLQHRGLFHDTASRRGYRYWRTVKIEEFQF